MDMKTQSSTDFKLRRHETTRASFLPPEVRMVQIVGHRKAMCIQHVIRQDLKEQMEMLGVYDLKCFSAKELGLPAP